MKPIIKLFSVLVILVPAKDMLAQNKIEVNSIEVNTMLQKDNSFIVLDARTPREFSQGHIKGAVNIDANQPEFLGYIDKLDKNASYIVYCRTKNRSGFAVNYMLQHGFKTVYQMMDGITGWNQNGLPVAK